VPCGHNQKKLSQIMHHPDPQSAPRLLGGEGKLKRTFHGQTVWVSLGWKYSFLIESGGLRAVACQLVDAQGNCTWRGAEFEKVGLRGRLPPVQDVHSLEGTYKY
jgi:hypothetical protein